MKALTPRKALNKAFLKVKPSREEIERFKSNLIELLDRTNDAESEEFHKNLLSDFLKKTYYDPHYFINTKGRNDLVIHNGSSPQSPVGVIIETKKPTNKSEMVSAERLNTKAFQELVLYYLRERIIQKNLEVKHLIITNIYEWFIFDATVFDRLFAQNKQFVKQFEDFEAGRLADTKTDFFYKQIAEPFIESVAGEIEFACFNLQDYLQPLRNDDKADDARLIVLFKLLSPEHLLKLPFANDSNSLDKRFYAELLHIIGLTEVKEGSKRLIQRNQAGERHAGSLLEETIVQLDALDKISRLDKPAQYGSTYEERLFNVAMELIITWINRILFLKLLEAQLIAFHKGDRAYAFLDAGKIKSYDDLNTLFFQVLARPHNQRNDDIAKVFGRVPYLNSSLFEPTEIEQQTIFISNLRDDKSMPVFEQTVLKDRHGKRRKGDMPTLQYLFAFLDAYDFSSEGSEEIQEENKTLINASVLGLIFEKINGYKDGSFFTPGFITMYMCRETIRRAVVQKFNEMKGWNCKSLDELYDKIEDRREANEIVNSLKICDPAVGSGHFLVSALNEIIAIKNDLKILQDRNGRRLKEYQVEVVNDELVITGEEGELFEYNPHNPESRRVQEALFHEKQTIIENCLFGVDINPNSVKICRLRLWIELLKNAYYKNEIELETLPNIDINIKCGNSLVSRFAIDADLRQALKKSKWSIESYRQAVSSYRNASNKEEKRQMERLIADIKADFRSEISLNDPKMKKLRRLQGELQQLTNQQQIFEMSKKEKAAWNKKVQRLTKEIQKLEAEIEEIKENKIFENAFEWRFEFPEVLNDEGDFVGFDVVMGNPPYIQLQKMKEVSEQLKRLGYQTYDKTGDIYTLFYEKGVEILKPGGYLAYITSNKWMRAGYGKSLRNFFLQHTQPELLIDLGSGIFEEATVDSNILILRKSPFRAPFKALDLSKEKNVRNIEAFGDRYVHLCPQMNESWTIASEAEQRIKAKIEAKGKPLKEWDVKIYRGILTGLNEAFIISTEKRNEILANCRDEEERKRTEAIIKPILRGRDIKRYYYDWAGLWVIGTFPALHLNIDDYPALKKYFLDHFDIRQLDQSGKKYPELGFNARKKTTNKWFETQDTIAYYQEFEKEKIYSRST
ncbi:MAG: type II restriction endonuclease [Thermonema sp.]|uniref:DUF7149 domain-containing protein n=1 Tax=Thermonema sp. TaxID=2231181 RepID=UPI0021DCA2B0|nr:Eco57I restriction-modification methylase domain-containing protein [Thermonema sp.]GIV39966.1 MAG: type II restriction endonuclease [Thermonema sp.]